MSESPIYQLYAYPNTYSVGVHLLLEESGLPYRIINPKLDPPLTDTAFRVQARMPGYRHWFFPMGQRYANQVQLHFILQTPYVISGFRSTHHRWTVGATCNGCSIFPAPYSQRS